MERTGRPDGFWKGFSIVLLVVLNRTDEDLENAGW